MSTTHQDKSGGKPRQRGRKADQRGQKREQQQSPKLDQRSEDQIDAMVAATEVTATDAPTSGAVAPAEVPLIGELLPPIGAAALMDNYPISIQAIANAYGDYTRKSFEESRSFVEKLMGVRSFDKAIEIQTDFARQAFVNFVAESQKISELYSELARQVFRPWERLAAKVTQAGRQIS
jgi:hypothetical protein